MKKFDFFNQYRDPVIVIKDRDEVVFRNNMFCHIFNNFENIRRFAHKMNFDMCPIESENIDLYSPVYQAEFSAQNQGAALTGTAVISDERQIINTGENSIIKNENVKAVTETVSFTRKIQRAADGASAAQVTSDRISFPSRGDQTFGE